MNARVTLSKGQIERIIKTFENFTLDSDQTIDNSILKIMKKKLIDLGG